MVGKKKKDALGPKPHPHPPEEMSGPNKYREWILETIDSLRSRKARPDLERICRMVRRRHGSDPDRTRAELEKLIQEQTVLKVSYKGSISYRNAAKVQRKSRKKSELTAGGGGGADEPRERTKHEHLNNNNNGDSALSFTDPEEGEEDPEPSPDPRAQTPGKKLLQPASSPSSGNGRLSGGGGATTSRAAGSGCAEERASAPRDDGSGPLAAEGGPPPGSGHRTGAPDGGGDGDASRMTASKPDAAGGGREAGPVGAETRSQTSCGSAGGSRPPPQTQRHSLPLKPKLRPAGGSAKPAGKAANSVLGDRLVASVRSLSEERRLRPGATPGHVKPLGLKEILGYLSSQERLSEEKLTRGKVKVVMEREVARGRLRRSRCGKISLPLRGLEPEEPRNISLPLRGTEPEEPRNISLPLRGLEPEEPRPEEPRPEEPRPEEPQPEEPRPRAPATDGPAKSALQDKPTVKKVGKANLLLFPTRPDCT